MSKQSSPLQYFDFTVNLCKDNKDPQIIIDALSKHCEKWGFQLEEGSLTKKKHYQGRFKLKNRTRKSGLNKKLGINIGRTSITSNTIKKDDTLYYDYVTKEHTRVDGPWTDSEAQVIQYIPKQVRKIEKYYPFQQYLVDRSNIPNDDDRFVNIIIDYLGNIGKSLAGLLVQIYGDGFMMPILENQADVMAVMLALLKTKPNGDVKSPNMIIFDLPRTTKTNKSMWTAIELIKKGVAYDTRYKWRHANFDSPDVWVFTNHAPNLNLLSTDRWKFWTVNDKKELVEWEDENIDVIDIGDVEVSDNEIDEPNVMFKMDLDSEDEKETKKDKLLKIMKSR